MRAGAAGAMAALLATALMATLSVAVTVEPLPQPQSDLLPADRPQRHGRNLLFAYKRHRVKVWSDRLKKSIYTHSVCRKSFNRNGVHDNGGPYCQKMNEKCPVLFTPRKAVPKPPGWVTGLNTNDQIDLKALYEGCYLELPNGKLFSSARTSQAYGTAWGRKIVKNVAETIDAWLKRVPPKEKEKNVTPERCVVYIVVPGLENSQQD